MEVSMVLLLVLGLIIGYVVGYMLALEKAKYTLAKALSNRGYVGPKAVEREEIHGTIKDAVRLHLVD